MSRLWQNEAGHLIQSEGGRLLHCPECPCEECVGCGRAIYIYENPLSTSWSNPKASHIPRDNTKKHGIECLGLGACEGVPHNLAMDPDIVEIDLTLPALWSGADCDACAGLNNAIFRLTRFDRNNVFEPVPPECTPRNTWQNWMNTSCSPGDAHRVDYGCIQNVWTQYSATGGVWYHCEPEFCEFDRGDGEMVPFGMFIKLHPLCTERGLSGQWFAPGTDGLGNCNFCLELHIAPTQEWVDRDVPVLDGDDTFVAHQAYYWTTMITTRSSNQHILTQYPEDWKPRLEYKLPFYSCITSDRNPDGTWPDFIFDGGYSEGCYTMLGNRRTLDGTCVHMYNAFHEGPKETAPFPLGWRNVLTWPCNPRKPPGTYTYDTFHVPNHATINMVLPAGMAGQQL